jgi:hypothetical protein
MVLRAAVLGLAVVMIGCGGDEEATSDAGSGGAGGDRVTSRGPSPGEMCDGTEQPALAAYAREDGELRWFVCSSEPVRRDVRGASDDIVWLGVTRQRPFEQTMVAYDASDGQELPAGGPEEERPEPPPPGTGEPTLVVVDGIRIEGGQDEPTTAFDEKSDEQLWTQPGSPPYDDVWAIGDGAVFVVDGNLSAGGGRIVAYELDSGEMRWERSEIDPYGAEVGWPWHVDGDELFTIWSNLAVLSTTDGSTRWGTDYPVAELPRMTGVRANDDSVFVAFSSQASGGD